MTWVLGAVGLATQVAGGVASSQASEKTGRAQQAAAEGEATQLEKRAKDTVAAASFNTQTIKRKVDQILAAQRAQAAMGGGDTLDGSVRDVAADTVKQGTIDELLTMAQAQDDASTDRYQAAVTRRSGVTSNALAQDRAKAQMLSTGTTILSGAANWRQKYGSSGATATYGGVGSGASVIDYSSGLDGG